MFNKKNILSIISVVTIIAIIVSYVLLSDNTLCKAIDIKTVNNTKDLILNKEHIKKIVLKNYPNLIGSPINDVNLSNLEHKIEAYPAVKNAEVYKKVNGILEIEIEQKEPIARVITKKGDSFYLGSQGSLIPISKTGSARVMIINGNINFNYKNNKISINDTTITKNIKEVYKIAKEISKDKFTTAQTEQIYITKNNEFEIIPTVGNHTVKFGDISNYRNKLKYLKHFYKDVLKEEGWRKYKLISLKYKNQIVCTLSDKKI